MKDQITALFKGIPKPLKHAPSINSSILKASADSLTVNFDGILGDEVSNKIHHGGENRVLHHYNIKNYLKLKTYFPNLSDIEGTIGENISSANLDESNVCIGDIYRIGEVIVQVTEPRKPCWTIDAHYQTKGIARFIQEQAITGWFYKVLRPGLITLDDSISLEKRINQKISIKFCIDTLLINHNKSDLELLANTNELSLNWKNPAREILLTGNIPDDRPRLMGPN